jgi:hypothetical protein
MSRKKPDSQTKRLRTILGGDGDCLPRVRVETQRRFHDYLVGHLAFPFEGRLSDPIGPHRDARSPLTVIRLMEPIKEYAPEEMFGLICKAEQNGERIELPLDGAEPSGGTSRDTPSGPTRPASPLNVPYVAVLRARATRLALFSPTTKKWIWEVSPRATPSI